MLSFKTLFADFFSLFYPRLCQACHRALISREECICSFCLFDLPLTNLYKERENPLSKIFWGRVDMETATALFYFQKGGKIQTLVHQFKYKGKTEIGEYFGMMLGSQLLGHPVWEPIDVIVPVPLHQKKQNLRGYNQSEVFGEGISKSFRRPLVTGNLVRITKTDTQTRKTRFRRWENVESVFHVNNPEFFKGKNILLVDDVVTTGSTLEACTQKLKEIKGVKVWVATIAMAT
jgi:ComF family protein